MMVSEFLWVAHKQLLQHMHDKNTAKNIAWNMAKLPKFWSFYMKFYTVEKGFNTGFGLKVEMPLFLCTYQEKWSKHEKM